MSVISKSNTVRGKKSNNSANDKGLIRNTKNNNSLTDGFEEIFSFHGHNLNVLGMGYIDSEEKGQIIDSRKYKETQFLSWDSNSIMLWERGGLKNLYKFPGGIKKFIGSIVFIPKYKVFVASANDFSFKVFSRRFDLLGAIPHKERAIIGLEYDNENDILLMSGSAGVSVWRFSRTISEDSSYILEKQYTFDGCTDWVSNLIFDQHSNRAFIINDRSVFVLSFRRRTIITKIENAHDAPLTRACWYPRSLFYITACSRGLVRCWTSHHNRTETKNALVVQDEELSDKKFSLLHTFRVHAKAVTGLTLHPVSGLLITAGLDGYIKVLNLELLSELFSVRVDSGITAMKVVRFNSSPHIMFSQEGGDVRLWKISNCCKYFANCASNIQALYGASEEHHEEEGGEPEDSNSHSHGTHAADGHLGSKGSLRGDHITSYAGQDVRVLSSKGQLVSKVEPDVIVDGVKVCILSTRQKLLFCLLENCNLVVFCVAAMQAVVLKVLPVGSMSSSSSDIATSMTLVDVYPDGSLRSEDNQWSSVTRDLRGDTPPDGLIELVVIGTTSGTLIFLDTMKDCNIIFMTQSQQGAITSIKKRTAKKELITFGMSLGESTYVVKVWRLPSMTILHDLTGLHGVSCWEISPLKGLFCVGSEIGLIRLFQQVQQFVEPCEILRSGHQHDGSVLAMSFCDTTEIFVSSSLDLTIKIWDYEKRPVRTIRFHSPSYSILLTGRNGDILISQRTYILTIPRDIWDDMDVLRDAKLDNDPWTNVENDFRSMEDAIALHKIGIFPGDPPPSNSRFINPDPTRFLKDVEKLKHRIAHSDPTTSALRTVYDDNSNENENDDGMESLRPPGLASSSININSSNNNNNKSNTGNVSLFLKEVNVRSRPFRQTSSSFSMNKRNNEKAVTLALHAQRKKELKELFFKPPRLPPSLSLGADSADNDNDLDDSSINASSVTLSASASVAEQPVVPLPPEQSVSSAAAMNPRRMAMLARMLIPEGSVTTGTT